MSTLLYNQSTLNKRKFLESKCQKFKCSVYCLCDFPSFPRDFPTSLMYRERSGFICAFSLFISRKWLFFQFFSACRSKLQFFFFFVNCFFSSFIYFLFKYNLLHVFLDLFSFYSRQNSFIIFS